MVSVASRPPKPKQPPWTQRPLTAELIRSAVTSAQYAKHEANSYEAHESARSTEIILTRVANIYGDLITAVANGRKGQAQRQLEKLFQTRGQGGA